MNGFWKPGSLPWLMRWNALLFWRSGAATVLILLGILILFLLWGTLSTPAPAGGPRFADEKALLNALWRGNAALLMSYLVLPLIVIALLWPIYLYMQQAQTQANRALPVRAPALVPSSPVSSRTLFVNLVLTAALLAWLLPGIFLFTPGLVNFFRGAPQMFLGSVAFFGMSLFAASLGTMFFTLMIWLAQRLHWWAVGISLGFVVLAVSGFMRFADGYWHHVRTEQGSAFWNSSSLIWLPGRAALGDPVSVLAIVLIGLCAFALTVHFGHRTFSRALRDWNEYRLPWFSARKPNIVLERPIVFQRGLARAVMLKGTRSAYAQNGVYGVALIVLVIVGLLVTMLTINPSGDARWVPWLMGMAACYLGFLVAVICVPDEAPALLETSPRTSLELRWWKVVTSVVPALLMFLTLFGVLVLRGIPGARFSVLIVLGCVLGSSVIVVFWPFRFFDAATYSRTVASFPIGLLLAVSLLSYPAAWMGALWWLERGEWWAWVALGYGVLMPVGVVLAHQTIFKRRT